jgi:outer membrane lipoprotein-sorting protein
MYNVDVKLKWASYVLGCLILAGCQGGGQPKTAQNVSGPTDNDPGVSTPPQPNSEVLPKGTEPPKANIPKGLVDPNTGRPLSVNMKPSPKPATGGWTKTQLKGQQLASNVSKAIASLKDAYGEAGNDIQTPEGSGMQQLRYEIGSNGKYRINYVKATAVPSAGVIISDGKRRTWLTDKGYAKPIAASQPSPEIAAASKSPVTAFPKEFSRLMFAPLTDKRDLWAPLTAELLRPSSGFKTVVEERTSDFNGQKVTSYRIYGRRAGKGEKKVGESEIEIVVHGKFWLPVTVRTRMVDAQGKTWMQQWTSRWKFNQKMDDKLFRIGPSANVQA